ncbi:MAG TPA: hypothetical protein VMT03_18860 [Polyangia bacterium]|nr:hypothetical protein [Polyangia bacterium]
MAALRGDLARAGESHCFASALARARGQLEPLGATAPGLGS